MTAEQQLQPAGVLTLADVVRFNYFHLSRFWFVPAFVFAFSVFDLFAVLRTGDPERLQNPGSSYLIGLAFSMLMFGSPYLGAWLQFAKLAYFRGPVRYHLTSDRIRLEGAAFSSEIGWTLVQNVYETNGAFLIYQSAQVAWILPKRFFWGQDALVQRCRQLMQQRLSRPGLFHAPTWRGTWL